MIMIDKIRGPIKTMSALNQAHTMQYMKILTNLSKIYNASK